MSSSSMIPPLALVLFLFSALTMELSQAQDLASMIPEGLLDFIPPTCMEQLSQELLPCAMNNMCFSLLPSEDEMDAIPHTEEDIAGLFDLCGGIEAAVCVITSRCPVCREEANNFFKCTMVEGGFDISQNTTDLIMGCTLDCASVAATPDADAGVVVATLLPTAVVMTDTDKSGSSVPTAAPGADASSGSLAPTAAAGDSDVTEAPTPSEPSGAVNFNGMAYSTTGTMMSVLVLGVVVLGL
eukprot:CAMPEP_0168187842 /NCGR_PEP_ID=MMETSP0139_2-20121125/15273_1 /TAXON_ID=44445 /ORGANISM="Pseudo-nitzschia australis, Strain 10249 10 AB" /LENGTH=240 /DNA_ID=CAMNT_0008110127 /DNA_START=133 /DNA_END=855 /DNA_ORIENTATION=+